MLGSLTSSERGGCCCCCSTPWWNSRTHPGSTLSNIEQHKKEKRGNKSRKEKERKEEKKRSNSQKGKKEDARLQGCFQETPYSVLSKQRESYLSKKKTKESLYQHSSEHFGLMSLCTVQHSLSVLLCTRLDLRSWKVKLKNKTMAEFRLEFLLRKWLLSPPVQSGLHSTPEL